MSNRVLEGNRLLRSAVAAMLFAIGTGTAVVHAGVLDGLFRKSPSGAAKTAGVVETAEEVRIPTSALESGKALFLALPHEGVALRYFALKCPDGKFRVALDACDVCFRANKGYRQEGGKVVCNNCDMKVDASRIGEAKGGCNPHGLPSVVDGGSVVVRKADLVAGKRYFVRQGG